MATIHLPSHQPTIAYRKAGTIAGNCKKALFRGNRRLWDGHRPRASRRISAGTGEDFSVHDEESPVDRRHRDMNRAACDLPYRLSHGVRGSTRCNKEAWQWRQE